MTEHLGCLRCFLKIADVENRVSLNQLFLTVSMAVPLRSALLQVVLKDLRTHFCCHHCFPLIFTYSN